MGQPWPGEYEMEMVTRWHDSNGPKPTKQLAICRRCDVLAYLANEDDSWGTIGVCQEEKMGKECRIDKQPTAVPLAAFEEAREARFERG